MPIAVEQNVEPASPNSTQSATTGPNQPSLPAGNPPKIGSFPREFSPEAMQDWAARFTGLLNHVPKATALKRCSEELNAVDFRFRQNVTGRLVGAIVAALMVERKLCPPKTKNPEKFVRQFLREKAFANSASACSRLPKAGAMWLRCGDRGSIQASSPDPYFPFLSAKLADKCDPIEAWDQLCNKLGRCPTERDGREFVSRLLGRDTFKPKRVSVVLVDLVRVQKMLGNGQIEEAATIIEGWRHPKSKKKGGEK